MNYLIRHDCIQFFIEPGDTTIHLSGFFEGLHLSGKTLSWLLKGNLLLNDKVISSLDAPAVPGDTITVMSECGDTDIIPSDSSAQVVYEDQLVYAVHKPAGIIIHSDDPEEETLARQAAAWQLSHDVHCPVRYLHRLDRDTTGLVLFCKVPFLQPLLDFMIMNKEIRRDYLAITHGKGTPGTQKIFNQPLGRDRHVSGKYRVNPKGKPARTLAGIIDRKDDLLLWKCRLETGRTHQIRVHLSTAGFPIVGDPMYGIGKDKKQPMALWACQISYRDPITGKAVEIHDMANPLFEGFTGKERK